AIPLSQHNRALLPDTTRGAKFAWSVVINYNEVSVAEKIGVKFTKPVPQPERMVLPFTMSIPDSGQPLEPVTIRFSTIRQKVVVGYNRGSKNE
ncbi:MAG: hypothetical protein KGY69_19975, partial [Bacteroidales bacterium]|nr:hypothetical protein [Bacteroidales bacterium]